jgi:hypothetical protein
MLHTTAFGCYHHASPAIAQCAAAHKLEIFFLLNLSNHDLPGLKIEMTDGMMVERQSSLRTNRFSPECAPEFRMN